MYSNNEKPKLSIVIPCFNEANNLDILLAELQKVSSKMTGIEIIIVNNGSTDNTELNLIKLAKIYGDWLKIIKVEENLGYGHGIMQGVLASRGALISWCHADLQTSPQQVINAYNAYVESPFDKKVVKGTRFGRSLFDTFFTSGMSLLTSLLFMRSLGDVNAQPKLFNRGFIPFLRNYPNDFSLDLFFLLQAHKNNFSVIEIPVEFKNRVFDEAKGGGSLKGKIKLIIRTFRYIIKIRFQKNLT